MPKQIDLNQCMNAAYFDALYDESRWLVLKGGSGSGKSVFASQKVLLRVMAEAGHRYIVTRKIARTLKESVFARLRAQIGEWDLSHLWEVNKSDKTLLFRPNASQIICVGLDDVEKLKSIERPTGFWHEEPTELIPYDVDQCNLRLRGNTPGYKQHILTFNPISALHWLKARFFDARPANCTALTTTYRDNQFIDDEYARELEALKDVDRQLYNVYALGEWGVLKGLIYKPYVMEAWPDSFDESFFGLDFGFNNQTALVRIDLKDMEVYLTELLYERELTTDDLIQRLRGLNIQRAGTIYGDPAEPDRIEQIRRAGFDCRPAIKGQGSVGAGIALCQSLTMHSRPENANLNAEAQSYKWAEDKDGNPTDQPVKFRDHLMDAMRYGLFTRLKDRLAVHQPRLSTSRRLARGVARTVSGY